MILIERWITKLSDILYYLHKGMSHIFVGIRVVFFLPSQYLFDQYTPESFLFFKDHDFNERKLKQHDHAYVTHRFLPVWIILLKSAMVQVLF